jgi:CubicO group peptidase (beta-lactamase class C family)
MNTKFNIGSIGKTFTAVAIMQLVQAGKLRLSDTLGKFLPDYPFPEKDVITIRHLLTHTSGLGDYLEHKEYACRKSSFRKLADALPLVYDQAPEFPAGERFLYSNSGFLVLGAIIEDASGRPYPDYLKERIFDPLGMTDSGIFFADEVVPGRSTGYTKNWDGTYMSNVRTVPPPCPAGGLQTTARDLLKFDRALYGASLLSEQSKEVLFTPTPLRPTYACGWEVKDYFGHRFVGHSGGADGVECYFYRFIDSEDTIITLSNYDGGNGQVCSALEAILFGRAYALPTAADAAFTLGYALQAKGMHREAVKVFARNLEGESPHLMSLFLSANSRILGDFEPEAALEDLERYIRLAAADAFPPIGMAWRKKASVLAKLGRTEEAVAAYEKALELDPSDARAKDELEKLLRRKTVPPRL